MGWFSKSPEQQDATPKDTLPTTTEKTEKKKGGVTVSDAVVAFLFFLFLFFFVIWPLVTTWFMCTVLWLILWPFMNFVPACSGHSWAGPAYTVLTMGVWSPIKVGKFIYHTLKKDDGNDDDDDKKKKKTEAAKPAATPVTAPTTQVADKV